LNRLYKRAFLLKLAGGESFKKKKEEGEMNRWVFRTVLSLVCVVLLGVPAGAADTVAISVIAPLSGPYAAVGEEDIRGTKLAIEEKGTLLGKKLEMVAIDDQNQPAVGARKVREAIESKGVRFFQGAVSSSVGLAIGQVAAEKQSIYVTSVGADEITGKNCNRFMFRWSVATYGAVQETLVPLIKKFPQAKKWYTITPDYVFGHSLLNNAQNIFKKFGLEHVGNDMHPIGHTEFSSFYTKAMAAKADSVVFFNFGKDTINALKQADNFGLKKKSMLVVPWSSGTMDLIEIGPEIAENVYFGCQFWHEVDVPLTQALNKAYMAKYKDPINYPAAACYIMTKMIIMAIEKAKSFDPPAVSKAMETLEWEGLTGKEFMQSFDHQTHKNYYLLLAKGKKDMKGSGDLATVVSSGKSFKPQAESDCKMK
jgi:branched-chain amino acid transport system substrate-binding protein